MFFYGFDSEKAEEKSDNIRLYQRKTFPNNLRISAVPVDQALKNIKILSYHIDVRNKTEKNTTQRKNYVLGKHHDLAALISGAHISTLQVCGSQLKVLI